MELLRVGAHQHANDGTMRGASTAARQLVGHVSSGAGSASPSSAWRPAQPSAMRERLLPCPRLVQEGAKAACMVLAYGTAKDRKKALKCMKVGGHLGRTSPQRSFTTPARLLFACSLGCSLCMYRLAWLVPAQRGEGLQPAKQKQLIRGGSGRMRETQSVLAPPPTSAASPPLPFCAHFRARPLTVPSTSGPAGPRGRHGARRVGPPGTGHRSVGGGRHHPAAQGHRVGAAGGLPSWPAPARCLAGGFRFLVLGCLELQIGVALCWCMRAGVCALPDVQTHAARG